MAPGWMVCVGSSTNAFSAREHLSQYFSQHLLSLEKQIFWSPNDFYSYEMEHFRWTIARVIVYCKQDTLSCFLIWKGKTVGLGHQPVLLVLPAKTNCVIFRKNKFAWFENKDSREREISQFLKHPRNNADPTWNAWMSSWSSIFSVPGQEPTRPNVVLGFRVKSTTNLKSF